MLSLHAGYDTVYLTDAVGNGTAAADYYTAAAGEPPGYWQGAGARALGLAGKVDAEAMRRLYHEDVGPDGQVLVRRQKPGKYPAAGGSLYDAFGSYVWLFIGSAGIGLGAVAIALSFRPPRQRVAALPSPSLAH